jgi:hypothetical protein
MANGRIKLGQFLIREGYITDEQCSEALQRQVVFGGKLGSNLLELFYIDEETLLKGLSYTCHAPAAEPEKLDEIPQEVIDAFPTDLAQKHKVIPFEISGSRIHLAMTNPNDMGAIDEIGFITGKVIKPFIATEMKVGLLLEKHYGVRRDRRFVSVPEEEMKRRKEWEEKKKKLQDAKKAEEAPLESSPRETSSADTAVQPTRAEPEIPVVPPPDPTTFDGASQSLARAENREEIAAVLQAFATYRLERIVLFIIKGDEILPWKLGGVWKHPERMGDIRFSLQEPSLIHDTVDSGRPYKGPLLEIKTHKMMIESLGGPFPSEVVAYPLSIRKRCFSVLYGDNAISSDSFRDLTLLHKITLKAALAFEVLILKAKILFQT